MNGQELHRMTVTDEQVKDFTPKMLERIGELTPENIAKWAIDFATTAYKDGYNKGYRRGLVDSLIAMVDGEDHALSLGPKLHDRDPRRSGGASGGSAGPSPEGGAGVSAGEGTQAGAGTGSHQQEIGDGLRSTGESHHSAGSGDGQDTGVSR